MKYLTALIVLILSYKLYIHQRQSYTPEALARSSLIQAMKAFSEKPTPESRRTLYEELLREPLWFEFGDVSHRSDGAGYTRSQEISSGITSCGKTLYAFSDEEALKRWHPGANGSPRPFSDILKETTHKITGIDCAQINPDGPGTARFSYGEMKALADGNIDGALDAPRP